MEQTELFNHLRTVKYNTTGKNLDWKIEIDNSEKKIRVMFQESNQKSDWFYNFCFPIVIGFLGKPYILSMGWYTVAKSCEELILDNVAEYYREYPDYEFEVCGYSFGGAMAQLFGVMIYEKLGIKTHLVTFGSPKPFFSLLSKFMARRCFKSIIQYAHWNDIVTWCIPLPSYYSIKNTRLGKFSLKGLFNPVVYHQAYSDASLYSEKK